MKSYILSCLENEVDLQSICLYTCWLQEHLRYENSKLKIRFLHNINPFKNNHYMGFSYQGLLVNNIQHGTDIENDPKIVEYSEELLKQSAECLHANNASKVKTQQYYGEIANYFAENSDKIAISILSKGIDENISQHKEILDGLVDTIRKVETPILIVNQEYKEPKKVVIAYEDCVSCNKAIDSLLYYTGSKFCNLEFHILMVGKDNADNQEALNQTYYNFLDSGFIVQKHLVEGNVVEVVNNFIEENDIDILLMGAFGKPRIKQFFLGSTTENLIKTCKTPILIFK